MRLRRDRVVVVLEHKIYVYNFADLKLLHQIETISNPLGLCALSPNSAQTVSMAASRVGKFWKSLKEAVNFFEIFLKVLHENCKTLIFLT